MPAMPAALRWAVGLVAVQAAAVAVVLVLLGYEAVAGASGQASTAVGVILFVAVLAAVLMLLAVSLHRRRRWARGPALVVELLSLPIGYSLFTGGPGWVGVLVLAAGLGAVAALLAPSTREALSAGPGGPGRPGPSADRG